MSIVIHVILTIFLYEEKLIKTKSTTNKSNENSANGQFQKWVIQRPKRNKTKQNKNTNNKYTKHKNMGTWVRKKTYFLIKYAENKYEHNRQGI